MPRRRSVSELVAQIEQRAADADRLERELEEQRVRGVIAALLPYAVRLVPPRAGRRRARVVSVRQMREEHEQRLSARRAS